MYISAVEYRTKSKLVSKVRYQFGVLGKWKFHLVRYYFPVKIEFELTSIRNLDDDLRLRYAVELPSQGHCSNTKVVKQPVPYEGQNAHELSV